MDKQKVVELSRKILSENTKPDERLNLEDQLVEVIYNIATSMEVSAEDFETKRDDKRAKSEPYKIEGDPKIWLRKKLESELQEMLKADSKNLIEKLGDVLESVENYTARY